MCSIRDRAIKKSLSQVAVIGTGTARGDGFLSGGNATAKSAPVACRLVPTTTRPREFVLADKSVARSEWQILFPLGTSAQKGNRVTVDTQTFEIIETDAGAAGKNLLTAFCKKTT